MKQIQSLQKVENDIFQRGTTGKHYVHKRIPAAIRTSYPPKKTHITLSLKTSDRQIARRAAPLLLAKIQAEFEEKKAQINLGRAHETPVRVTRMTDRQIEGALNFWTCQILLADDARRVAELDDDEFDELEAELTSQRQNFGRLIARGQVVPAFHAFAQFMFLCGIIYKPAEDELRRVAGLFLMRVVKVLDVQLSRLRGEFVATSDVAPEAPHPLYLIAPERAPKSLGIATWEGVFEAWCEHVNNRPKPTTVANRTAWADLRRFSEVNGALSPVDVTPEMMTAFVKDMAGRIGVETLNNRLKMVRKIYATACGKHVISINPATHTLGRVESDAKRRKKKRLPFDRQDLSTIFSSQVYTLHRRSEGQSGEATYWIPLIMFYTGARPEEVAGLALADLKQDPKTGFYFEIVDRYDEDDDLFDDEENAAEVPGSHCRTLKNGASRRKIPVARQLLDLGLLRYVDYVRESGSAVFFPTLRKDHVGKLCGAFVKVFSRIKRIELGILNERKVLYSFRHTMKDFLQEVDVPSKYLRRILGHTAGEGATTDGYGSDLPFELVAEHFARVRFSEIPALPWEPGRGGLELKNNVLCKSRNERVDTV